MSLLDNHYGGDSSGVMDPLPPQNPELSPPPTHLGRAASAVKGALSHFACLMTNHVTRQWTAWDSHWSRCVLCGATWVDGTPMRREIPRKETP